MRWISFSEKTPIVRQNVKIVENFIKYLLRKLTLILFLVFCRIF